MIEAFELFESSANKKKIILEKVSDDWIALMIQGTQICNFKTEELLNEYVEHALSNIPKKAIIK